ncbi:Crp/Fnr family transcriptional regulator [Listeria ivanovii]|uniref:Crp/Fnr family transcriptional regulator n=1 Tax=Listeria ivanovii TaxID=1638 RepID=UPI0005128A8C|nr:Crp/Fnr family transcriptional regulator [Listeria ivanovii]AIS62482.1 Crp/Fnr family transcriptional regulator [Listeria ivanovii subsp. londoniensis]MBC2254046.1 Crp/Fnr family transcriptional regulator [Listeria ivanovii]MBK1965054.1 Crp/Fnr family transcriptional regulator [Listeria ivanovii subsp. londoniensis]MBK1984574.1 Crp/Fnr family transcriptional regulator [Listeria ivanovii subsp. londoniensis]MBK1995664.1 Crp/Fnr family transcriptional regulator [Listeria ivanovii subsp. londo
MDHDILNDYVNSNDFQVITRKKRKYLTYEGLEDSYVYILKKGIIKTSIISRDGREFNLGYINKMDIVSLLKDEYSQFANAPFNIRVESDSAELYQVDRVRFWRDVNQDKDLQFYVKDYYRTRLLQSIKKMQQMLMNGKLGAICTQLYELYNLFGVEIEENQFLIDFLVSNEEIGHFCGINSASSVNRIFQQLKSEGVITMKNRYIIIKKLDVIQENVIF